MIKTSIILPTYNERENITFLVNEIINNMSDTDYEIIIVDDNSPDGTGKLVQNLSKTNKSIRTIIRTGDMGLPKSIKEGILNSLGGYIIIMDTDFSHPPSFVPCLLENIQENDMVSASRYVKGGSMDAPRYKFFLSKSLNQLINLILGLDMKDLTGGFFIIKKEVLNNIDLNEIFKGYKGDYFFRLSVVLKNQNRKIKEIPFRYGRRKYGYSKTVLIKVGIDYIIQALKIRLGFA